MPLIFFSFNNNLVHNKYIVKICYSLKKIFITLNYRIIQWSVFVSVGRLYNIEICYCITRLFMY